MRHLRPGIPRDPAIGDPGSSLPWRERTLDLVVLRSIRCPSVSEDQRFVAPPARFELMHPNLAPVRRTELEAPPSSLVENCKIQFHMA